VLLCQHHPVWQCYLSFHQFVLFLSNTSQNISCWKGPTKITKSNPWLLTDCPKANPMSENVVQTLPEFQHLRPCPLPWAACSMPTAPLVQTLSLTPSCPSPGTAPCHSLRSCLCHREQSSALPLHSQWGSWEMGRLLKDCDQLSVQKIQRQNWKSFLIRDKDLVGTAELRNT